MRVLTRPNVGGPTRQMVALWHACAALGWQTLLVVGQCEDEAEFDLRAAGLPQVARETVDATSAGFVVVPHLRRSVHPLDDLRAVRDLRALMQRFAPDVVHTHTSKAGALARPLAAAMRVGVVAHTFHGHVLEDYFGKWQSWLLRRLETQRAKATDLLFAVSPSCRAELAALGVAPAERIAVLPPAVDVTAFAAATRAHARTELGVSADAFVLGFVGRLVPVKRPQRFAELLAAMPDATGLVFGDGPLRATLESTPRLRLLGATERLAALLPACDVLVFTSVREGCPLAAVEAFAAGVPVVGLDVPGVRDVLDIWGAGVLVAPERGVEGLRAACQSLRDGPARDELVARGRAGVARFAPASVARELVTAYVAAMERRRAH